MQKKIFTLIEILVVVSIIIILASITTLVLKRQLTKSQDTSRITDLNNISNGLSLYFQQYGQYPIPDNFVEIKYNGKLLSKQGKVGEYVTKSIQLNNIPTDPKTEKFYDYVINFNGKKYQLNVFLNNTKVYTDNNGQYLRSYYTLGDKVGILYNQDKTELSGNIDLIGQTTIYYTIFSNKLFFDNLSGDEIGIDKIIIDEYLLKNYENLYLYYSFEDGDIKTVYDVSNSGNNAILSGTILPQYSPGIYGYGLNFLSKSKIISQDIDLNQGNISFWINISSLPSANINLIDKTSNYKIILDTAGKIICDINGIQVTSTVVLSLGKWYFVSCNFSSNGIYLYIDGNLDSSNSSSISPVLNDDNVVIGDGFNGILDELMFFAKPLPESAINLLYNK